MDEKVYKETYDDFKKRGHMNKTSYDKYVRRCQERNSAQQRREYEERKIKLSR